MKIKTGDINKIEIFAPGTAGERAIRVETKDDVQIFDIEEYPLLEMKSSKSFVEEFYETDENFTGSLGRKF